MARLTPEAIVTAATVIVEHDGAEALTVRRLGAELDADPTSIYRHFADFDELRRAVGDRLLRSVLRGVPAPHADNWREVMTATCVRLRHANLRNPSLAALVRSAPSLHDHESAITERLLWAFALAGLSAPEAANGYHAVIELTIGSAAIDAPVAALPARQRAELYRTWRTHYSRRSSLPYSANAAEHLYQGSADDRFRRALDALLNGLVGQSQ